MNEFSSNRNIYVLNDLTSISVKSGKFFLINYKDILSHPNNFGDVFDVPNITIKKGLIYEVEFLNDFNLNPSEKAFQTSIHLKSTLVKILDELSKIKNNDPNAEQAYLIFSNFESRWLEADNLTCNEDGSFKINQWGIKLSNFPKPPVNKNLSSNIENIKNHTLYDDPIEPGEIKKLKTEKTSYNSIGLYIVLIIMSIIVLYFFLSRNENKISSTNNLNDYNLTSSTSSRKNKDTLSEKTLNNKTFFFLDKPRNVGLINNNLLIYDEKTGSLLNNNLRFLFYDNSSNLVLELDGESAKESYKLIPGNYKLVIKHKLYHKKEINIKVSKNLETQSFNLRKKGIIRRIIDKLKKNEY